MHLCVDSLPTALMGHVQVSLDGVVQDEVVEVDDVKGFAIVFLRDGQGEIVMNGDRPARKTLWSKNVEIKLV